MTQIPKGDLVAVGMFSSGFPSTWHEPFERGPKLPVEIARSHAAVPLSNSDNSKRVASHRCVSFDRLVIVDILRKKGNDRVFSHKVNRQFWTPFKWFVPHEDTRTPHVKQRFST